MLTDAHFLSTFNSPFGILFCVIQYEDEQCIRLYFPFEEHKLPQGLPTCPLPDSLAQQFQAYFSGCLNTGFALPISQDGTAFQKKVWQAILDIPYGQTRTYSDLAVQLQSHPRAIGQACGKNPLPIIIPCHRVVAKQGLGGFALSSDDSHLNVKKYLLALEKVKS